MHASRNEASLEFVATYRFTPLYLLKRSHPEKPTQFLSVNDDEHVFAYEHYDCKANREHDFDTMCEALIRNGLSCICWVVWNLGNLEESHNDGGGVDLNG